MDKIEKLLTRGVDKIYPSKEELEKVLRSDKKLKIYQGFDPTGTQLHIGHMVGLRKLRQWQDMGHHVIFVIGDGTGQAGDPSGKTTARKKFFTQEELRRNAVSYIQQAGKIVRFEGENAVEVLFNGDWLNKLKLVDILNILRYFSFSQLAERDLYRERLRKKQELNLREFFYPVLQAYDSVAMNIDLELGGTDQTFNMLMGRHLVKAMQKREKFVMTTPLLTDSKGQKIGKTEGNIIALTDKPSDLFGKIMSLPDDAIVKGLEYLTDLPINQIQEINKHIKRGDNPMPYKKKLAFEIVKQLSSHDEAHKAQQIFEKGPVISSTIELSLASNPTASDIVVGSGLASSKSEADRLIKQGGIKIDNKVVQNPNESIKVGSFNVQRGPRKLVKIKVK